MRYFALEHLSILPPDGLLQTRFTLSRPLRGTFRVSSTLLCVKEVVL